MTLRKTINNPQTTRFDKILNKIQEWEKNIKDLAIKFDISDLIWLADESIKVLKNDSILLQIEAPITILGDIHGQFYDLMRFIKMGGNPSNTRYLFLGDYVDRGRNSIETLAYLLVMKCKYPRTFFLLRGNHETPEICRLYGFYNECCLNYTPDLWNKFNEVFDYLPLAAIISERIFAVHGGLSPDLKKLQQISNISRPLKIPEYGLLADLLWSDPSPDRKNGYAPSERGTSYYYGPDIVDEFLKENDFDLICRGHQVVQNGYEFPHHPSQKVLTVFSAPNYCEEFGNKGAMLIVDDKLQCKFLFVEPSLQKNKTTRPITPKSKDLYF